MEYRYIKGVMDGPSGKTMRVDFNPFKTCSFNCVYCVLGLTTEMTTERREFYPVGEVFAEIRRHIEENGKPDAILLTGSGEPALYSGFGDLAMRIKEAYPDVRRMVYTNGSLMSRKDVRHDFSLCDIVWLNLNTADEVESKRINRNHRDISLLDALEGIRKFRGDYEGVFYVDTKFFKGLNDSERNLEDLRAILTELLPDSYSVIIKRFEGRHGIELPTEEFKALIKEKFNDLPFPVTYDF